MIRRRAVVSTLFLVVAWASRASAELTFTPGIMVREEYNDNIDLTKDNRRHDFITTVTPSLNALIDTNLLKLSLDYGLFFKLFAKHSEDNETSLAKTQRVRFDTTYNPIRDILFLKVSDVYARVPIDERRPVAAGNDFVNTTDSNILTVNPYIVLPLTSSISLTAGYTYKNIWYDDPEGETAQDHSATGRLTKTFGERLSIYGEYAYRAHRPKDKIRIENILSSSFLGYDTDGNPDFSFPEPVSSQESGWNGYDTHTGMIGAVLQVTPKLTLSGSAGKIFYRYKSGTLTETLQFLYGTALIVEAPPVLREYRPADSDSLIWNAQANYLLSERFTVTANYAQDFYDSVNDGAVKRKTTGGSIKYKQGIEATLAGFYTNSDYETEDREDKSAGGTLSARVPLGANLAANVGGSYTRYRFSPDEIITVTEKVNRYTAQASLEYTLRLLTMGLGYTWNYNDSNVNVNDYRNNIVWLQARLTY